MTQQGDTLCSLINLMGVNLSQGSVPTTGGASNSSALGSYANNLPGLLREFYKYNRNLKLENGQSITLIGAVPVTGASSQSGSTTSNASGASSNSSSSTSSAVTPAASASSKSYSCDIPRGMGLYRLRRGESVASVAQKFGVTVQQILDDNPGRTTFMSGDVIYLPGVEAPGLWNMTALGCNDAPNTSVNTTSR